VPENNIKQYNLFHSSPKIPASICNHKAAGCPGVAGNLLSPALTESRAFAVLSRFLPPAIFL